MTNPPFPQNQTQSQVCVLSSGHQLFFGEAAGAVDWFSSSLGYPIKYVRASFLANVGGLNPCGAG